MSLDGSATPSVSRDKKTAARPHPFSIRLSPSERAQLEAEAQGMPLGAYIKRKALSGPALRQRASVADREALAQILALLGQSRISNNLNQLAHAANLGILEQTTEEQAELAFCLASIAQMRGLLIQSLGLKDGGTR
ncbi:MAG: hypothetical protein C0456_06245 [Hyphomonas sp.]|uniref:plasmid mobilization protein n=1 Tax=Hyphomonas sp. TaxID=87 RepID=UPI001D48E2AF|nr:plasmid mobilization relaxosome protein MobC [Hyphomonas sp.]MBA4226216.1 hypothetical protein [Hyphomonas sp.]